MKEKKISVCFIMPKAYPVLDPEVKGVFGGAEVDLVNLSTELAKDNKYDVNLLVADYGQNKTEIIDNVTVKKALSLKTNKVIAFFQLTFTMFKMKSRIFFLETISPAVPFTALFCKLFKKNFVSRTAHQYEFDGTYAQKKPLLYKLYKWALKNASVITQNESDRKMLKNNLNINALVMKNAHRIPTVSKNQKSHILWVGRSADFKNPYLFLELAEKFPKENFVMICQRATGDKNYQNLTRKADKIKNLTFYQRVPFDRINSFFSSAKLLVSTSSAEGFPNVFIQACINASPILSLNVNPDNFLIEYNCGICCSNDKQKLQTGLNFLLENKRFLELGENAKRYAKQNHDIEKIISQYKNLFCELAQNK